MQADKRSIVILHELLFGRDVAALATLHEGRPFASMVPFACAVHGGRLRLVVHVSGLASHTRDMRTEPEVCLLITAADSGGVPPQALPRLSLPGRAEFIPPDHPEHAVFKAAYLDKFPEAADLFSFADFSLVAIEPTSGRLVAGFARATTLAPETLVAAASHG